MRLESMWLHGFRRFGGRRPTRVRLDSPLVCLIGANEVGKSSLLDALTIVGDSESIDRREWTRGERLPDDREIIRLRYRLESGEEKLLRQQDSGKDLAKVRWLVKTLQADGSFSVDLEPRPPHRQFEPRWSLAASLRREIESEDWPPENQAKGTPAGPQRMEQLLAALESDSIYITDDLPKLSALADWMEERGRDSALVRVMRAVHELESQADPIDVGRHALEERVPRFVRFEPSARQLDDEYELVEVVDSPPPPLHNLARLAKLDLRLLLEQIQDDLTGSARATLDAANAVLRDEFTAWRQRPPVTVSFDRSGTTLLIHVQSGSGMPMKPRERSEGLRQFVALVALTAGEGHLVPPILLIDEAEMHLHYDAQADLLEVLSKQTTAAQVIYTTHSSACLPEDLGSSVRVVRGVADEMRSEVAQQFWSDDVGLVPLLLAMGAGSMAFVPLRPAVIAEGGSELVLLPSLIKEAARIPKLGYQVVPGAAGVPPTRIAGLDLEGVRTAWVLDGDQGGKKRRGYLIKQGVPEERIHLLEDGSDGLELEDFISPETYVAAVNSYAKDVQAKSDFDVSDLPAESCHRHDAVVSWFADQDKPRPGKTAIANKVLELRGSQRLSDPDRCPLLRELHQALRKQLRVASH